MNSFFFRGERHCGMPIAVLFLSISLLAFASPASAATLSDGMSASDVLGQTTFTSSAAATTQTGMSLPRDTAIDTSGHRLFVADANNNRVLVYNLNADNTLPDRTADNVLGQANFTSSSAATTQAGMSFPQGLLYDGTGNRLFVADGNNRRLLVFDVTSITDGENAVNVLGKANFTTSTAATTQSGTESPLGIAYDSAGSRLFMADYNNSRVLVFDINSIADGENAVNVLGQANFTSATSATSQSGMSFPSGLAYSATGNRLFVSDSGNRRVLVFDVASITDGENAVNVLGQANFTSSSAAASQSGFNYPEGLAFDATGNRLFAADYNNSRVLVFDVASITDGENAINVLGQSSFTASTSNVTQTGMNHPEGLAYDATWKRLYVADANNNRVLVFDLMPTSGGTNCPTPSIALAKPNGGESFLFGGSELLFWSGQGCNVTGLRLSFSIDGGTSYPTLVANGVYAGQGYYSWTIPDVNTTTGRIKAELLGLGGAVLATDASDGNFTIIGTPPPVPAPIETAAPATETAPVATPDAAVVAPTTQTYAEGTNDAVPLTAEELAAPSVDPNSTGGIYDAGSAVAATPTIDIDKGIEPPPPDVKLPCVGGTLVKVATSTAVYYCAKNGKRFVFPNPFVYFSWFADFKNVKVITPEELAVIPLGGNITYKPGVRMVKVQTDPKVYAIARDGLLRWVSNEEVAAKIYGPDWNRKVDDVLDSFFFNYKIGDPVIEGVGTAESTAPVPPASTAASAVGSSQSCSSDMIFTEFLGIGSSNAQVVALQDLLKCLGLLPSSLVSSGYFGDQTSDAVKNFQSANGIEPRGYVGPGTRDALNGKY